MNVSVVGVGSWGTTVALLLAREQTTRLWVRSAEQAKAMSNERENRSYLPGVRLPPELIVTADPKEALVDADVVLMAVPSHGFRQVLMRLAPTLTTGVAVVSLAKGIEEETHLRMSEIIADVLPGSHAGVLTGPNLAREVAQGQPAASVV